MSGAATSVVTNTIIGQGDTGASDWAIRTISGGTAPVDGSTRNLIRTITFNGDVSGILNSLTDDPELGPLQNNGGRT